MDVPIEIHLHLNESCPRISGPVLSLLMLWQALPAEEPQIRARNAEKTLVQLRTPLVAIPENFLNV